MLSLTTTCVAAKTTNAIPDTLKSGWNAINPAELKADITFLTSDQFGGRLSLTPENEKAIKWIADQFKQIGLKPAFNNSYLQPVPLIEFFPDHKKSYVLLEQGGKRIKWKNPDIYLQFPKNISLSGEVVFAGFGITAPELHYDDYAHIDVKGKIVMVFEHEPEETNPASVFNGVANTIYATPYLKTLNAQQHGAIAVIIIPEPNRKHPSNQERRKRMGKLINLHVPSQVLVDDKIQIPYVVVTDKIAKQIAGKQISLSKLQTKIDQLFKPQSTNLNGIKITLENVNKSQRIANSYNVVGLLEGTDPSLQQETIIISAHHDHDGQYNHKIWRGADDNASGTVGVIALARAMMVNTQSSLGLQPKRSILFVVFGAEERGLLGSFYMAEHPLRPLSTTRAMINFDMIGRNEEASPQTEGLINTKLNTTNRLNLIGAHYSPDYNKTVEIANQFVGLQLDHRFDNDSALNIFFRSDQFPFVLQHIPAFWWFTGFHPDYHQATDTADKINYVKMKKILRLSYLSTYAFANEKTPPRFIINP